MWPFLDITVCFGGFHLVFEVVTHTQNLCSAFKLSKVHTHSSEHTHTHTHTVGSLFLCCSARGAVGGSVLAQGHFVVVLKVERELNIHSPHLQFLSDRDSNSQPIDYESDSLTNRPRLAASKCLTMPGGAQRFITVWTNNRNQNVLLYGVMFIAD